MPDLRPNSELIAAARQEGDALVATVRGEVDLHNSPELRAGLMDLMNQTKPRRLVLNLEQVPYMDSSAIAVVVESLQKLKRSGGKVYLTGLQPRVKGLLEIARLDAIFVIAKDEAEALAK
jgi:anti-sigma B factor antagonist